MSWGGFFSTRYAVKYPENVDKVYLDAPLLCFWDFDPAKEKCRGGYGPRVQMAPAHGMEIDDPTIVKFFEQPFVPVEKKQDILGRVK